VQAENLTQRGERETGNTPGKALVCVEGETCGTNVCVSGLTTFSICTNQVLAVPAVVLPWQIVHGPVCQHQGFSHAIPGCSLTGSHNAGRRKANCQTNALEGGLNSRRCAIREVHPLGTAPDISGGEGDPRTGVEPGDDSDHVGGRGVRSQNRRMAIGVNRPNRFHWASFRLLLTDDSTLRFQDRVDVLQEPPPRVPGGVSRPRSIPPLLLRQAALVPRCKRSTL